MSGIKQIVEASSFQIFLFCFCFCNGLLVLKLFKFKVVKGLFGHPILRLHLYFYRYWVILNVLYISIL